MVTDEYCDWIIKTGLEYKKQMERVGRKDWVRFYDWVMHRLYTLQTGKDPMEDPNGI